MDGWIIRLNNVKSQKKKKKKTGQMSCGLKKKKT